MVTWWNIRNLFLKKNITWKNYNKNAVKKKNLTKHRTSSSLGVSDLHKNWQDAE